MGYSDNVQEFLQQILRKELKDKDVMDYISVLDNNADHLSEDRKKQVRDDFADLVLKNKDLAKRVAELHTEQDNAPKVRAVQPLYLGCTPGIPGHQVGFVAKLSERGQILATAPDVYRYLKTLENLILNGTHEQITNSRNRVSNLKYQFPFLTSTRLFYYPEQHTAKMVHNYGGSQDEQVHSEFPVPTQKSGNEYWKVVKRILGTTDPVDVLLKTFSLVYKVSPFQPDLFPDKDTMRNITCGAVHFDSAGMHIYKCGEIWKEKWGYALYKTAPKKK